jgi:hypothetical protein
MTAEIIDFTGALDVIRPLPVQDTTRTVLKVCGESYSVQTTIDRATKRGFQIIIDLKSEKIVIARTCGEGDDPRIVDAAIEGWRAGVRRGRQQMCEEIELPA